MVDVDGTSQRSDWFELAKITELIEVDSSVLTIRLANLVRAPHYEVDTYRIPARFSTPWWRNMVRNVVCTGRYRSEIHESNVVQVF